MAIASVATVVAPTGGSLADQYPGSLLDDGVNTGTSVRNAVSATANVTPHADGTYVEIDPSLSADASGVFIYIVAAISNAATDTSTLLEIATGAAASEVAWATVAVGYRTGDAAVFVPGFIASGTRVAVRVRSAVSLQAVSAQYEFLPATKSVDPPAPTSMGVVTAASRGTTVTAPGSLNTKGAWTEIVASTAADFENLYVGPQGVGGTTMSGSGVLLDIGIGAAAAETVLIGGIYLAGNASEYYRTASPLTYGVTIPAGSRLSARYARANANNAVDVLLVGA